MPLTGHALELVSAALVKLKPRPDHEVARRPTSGSNCPKGGSSSSTTRSTEFCRTNPRSWRSCWPISCGEDPARLAWPLGHLSERSFAGLKVFFGKSMPPSQQGVITVTTTTAPHRAVAR